MTSTLRAGLIGAGIGGASMFLLDPDRGARRRAVVRDKAVWVARKTRDAAGATGRDLGNRLEGVKARARRSITDEPVDDRRLGARVRAALGHATSHPRAISLSVADGCVCLMGDALESEIDSIVSAVEAVPGVKSVQNELRAHPSSDGVPSLQGGSASPNSVGVRLIEGWSPTAICAASVAAGGLAIMAAALSAGRR